MNAILEQIENMLRNNGTGLYGGEAVTQTEHALQCAYHAEQESASSEMVTAALLHDIGHLLEPEFEAGLERGEDLYHEDLGEAFLENHFPVSVTQPVKLHVAAKRYLCATDDTYFAKLSPASVHTLGLQGGPMSAAEVAEFESHAHFKEAVRLRIWDDMAKDPQLETPDVSHYMTHVRDTLENRA